MRIGIITPAITYGDFIEYFDDGAKKILETLPNNNNVPAPSLIAKGLIKENHFVRMFTIGEYDLVLKSERIDIMICKPNKLFTLLCPFSEITRSYTLYRSLKRNISDLDILHSHWSYYTALSTVPFAKQIKTFCTVRDWTPTIISYLPNRKKRFGIYFNAIMNKMPESLRARWFITKFVNAAAFFITCKPDLYWKSKLLINNYVFKQEQITFIANSLYTQELIEKKTGRKVPCIMNMIDDRYLLQIQKSKDITKRIITIQSMLDRRKNIGALVEAIQLVKNVIPEIRMTFLYSFPENTLFLYEDFNIWKSKDWLDIVDIHCNVPHNKIYDYIDESAMLVHPSLEESFGNTIVEGMMRKTPIVGGKQSGAVPYLLDFGNRGYVCDVMSPNDIASTIIQVFRENDIASYKAEIAYDWVASNNTPKAIIAQHIKCYTN